MVTCNRRKKERGQAMVEFAFVFPIFLGVLIGLAAFSILFFSYVTLQLAVREGTSAIVHDPAHQTVSSIQTLVRSQSFSLNTASSQLQILVEPPESQWVSGVQVSVSAAYYVPMPTVNIPVLGNGTIRLGTIQIRAQSVMTIE
jgi:Flp pilus assembly protein TadG